MDMMISKYFHFEDYIIIYFKINFNG